MKGLSANIFIDVVCGQQWINGFSNATFKRVAIHNSSYKKQKKKQTKNKSFSEYLSSQKDILSFPGKTPVNLVYLSRKECFFITVLENIVDMIFLILRNLL